MPKANRRSQIEQDFRLEVGIWNSSGRIAERQRYVSVRVRDGVVTGRLVGRRRCPFLETNSFCHGLGVRALRVYHRKGAQISRPYGH